MGVITIAVIWMTDVFFGLSEMSIVYQMIFEYCKGRLI